ncbi:MAG TPA: Sec-independent protein translocase protein TatB [Caulobacteraceae bacterium]|jgi:sec-independent protein translocase protein TatB
MLPDLSPTHILIVLVVALIVVGPKDLPVLLRKIGKFVGRMRGMANEFRNSFDEMARQTELDELRKEVEAMRNASQAAIPHDLGIEAAMKSDAEAAYMANWEASHAPSADAFFGQAEPANSILPPPAGDTPALPAAEPAAGPAKPRRAPKKAATADDGASKPAPKPRARKPKPEGEA